MHTEPPKMDRIPFYIYCVQPGKCESRPNILYYLMIFPTFVVMFCVVFRLPICVCVCLWECRFCCCCCFLMQCKKHSCIQLGKRVMWPLSSYIEFLVFWFNCRVCECLKNCHSNCDSKRCIDYIFFLFVVVVVVTVFVCVCRLFFLLLKYSHAFIHTRE